MLSIPAFIQLLTLRSIFATFPGRYYSVDVPRCLRDAAFAVLMFATLIFAASTIPATAQSTATSSATTPPPSDPTAIFPLDQVHRGLQGTAWTVFEGTQPEPMQVEILGVLHDAIGPGQDMILARLHGEKPEYTGVVAGMSGSPVYIDGKLLGALSYRIGQFTKEPIAGITPIASMLAVAGIGPSLPSSVAPYSTGVASPSGTTSQSRSSALFLETQHTPASSTIMNGTPSPQPIEAPLVFDGFSPQAMKLFANRFTALGFQPIAGLGGASPEAKQPAPIIPGSAVSAVLVRGDLSMAATCTVTYVDPKRLLACGHPITQFGEVSMPMTKADVVLTLSSPLNSFKIINTTETVGSFTQDRMTAIYGRFGEMAKMIPVVVTVTSADKSFPSHTLHFEVLNNPKLTPQAVLVSVYQAVQGTNSSADEMSYRMTGTLNVKGHAPVRMDTLLSPNDQFPASVGAAVFVNDHFSRIYDDPVEQPDITGLTLQLEALSGRHSATLDNARLSSTEARPGDRITVEVTLHPYHGEPSIVRIPFTLPADLQPGTLRLMVSDGATLDRLLQPAPFVNQRPLPLDATIAQLNRQHADDRLYVTLLEHAPQAVLQDQALPTLPVSMANVLQPLHDTQQLSLTGESAVELASAVTASVPSGAQVLTLTLR